MNLTLLAPYAPSREDPWNAANAAHLCRRAGFGAPRRELQEVLELGPEQAVERFLRPDPQRDEELTARSVSTHLAGRHDMGPQRRFRSPTFRYPVVARSAN